MAIITKNIDDILPATKEELERIDAINDDQIDTSEIPELDEEWFKTAKAYYPEMKKAISLRVDWDVLEWFKAQAKGRNYKTLMNAVLKSYIKVQKERQLQKVS